MRMFSRTFLLVVAVVAMAGLLGATPIVGQFSVNGNVKVGVNYIDWSDRFGAFDAPAIGGTTTGYSQVGSGFTGYFLAIPGDLTPTSLGINTEMLMLDLQNAVGLQQTGHLLSLANFMKTQNFTVAPPADFVGLTLTLTQIVPGQGCVGFSSALCTALPLGLNGTPFNLTYTGGTNTTTVTFDVRGDIFNGLDLGAFTGRFSANFPDSTPDTILGLLGTTGYVTRAFSGTIDATGIPEPATTSMMFLGGALLGAAGLLKKFRAKK